MSDMATITTDLTGWSERPIFELSSDVRMAARQILAWLCNPQNPKEADDFLEEMSRWIRFKNSRPDSRLRRSNSDIERRSAQNLYRLRRTLKAAEIFDLAYAKAEREYFDTKQPVWLPARSINDSVARLISPGEEVGNRRKVVWQRNIPVVHVASAFKFALATKISADINSPFPRFWIDFYETQGAWVDEVVFDAEARARIAVGLRIIPPPQSRLILFYRASSFPVHAGQSR